MIIRKAKKEDFEQYFKYGNESKLELKKYYDINVKKINKNECKRFFLKRIKHKNWLILVLENNKRIEGYFEGFIMKIDDKRFLHDVKEVGYINDTYIQPKFRKKSYFSLMLKEFEKELKRRKVKFCKLHVSIKNPIKTAYGKLGFKKTEFTMLKRIT